MVPCTHRYLSYNSTIKTERLKLLKVVRGTEQKVKYVWASLAGLLSNDGTRLLCLCVCMCECVHTCFHLQVETQCRELRFLTHVHCTHSFLCKVEVSPFLYLEQEGHPQQRERGRRRETVFINRNMSAIHYKM